jgi:Tfp pilus assembly protein PilO
MKKFLAEFDVREKAGPIAAVILVWLAINLGFAFLVNLPRAREVSALDEQVGHVAGLTKNREDDVARLRQHHDRVMEGNTSLDKFYEDVLSTKNERLIGFQRELREIAKKFNINMETITYPRETYPKDKVTKFSAVMPLTGSYENLREFIDTIEKSENFIVIESIQLASSKEGGVILSLAISVATYFVDPDMQEPTAPQAGKGRGRT